MPTFLVVAGVLNFKTKPGNPKDNPLFSPLLSLSKNCKHNEAWSCEDVKRSHFATTKGQINSRLSKLQATACDKQSHIVQSKRK